jgi:hypothetical protein
MILGFLRSTPGLRQEDPRPALPEAARGLVGADRFLRTSPAVGGLDGFFAALLVREGDPAAGAGGGEAS